MAAIELFNTTLFSDANLVSYYRAENLNDSKGSNNLTDNGSVPFNAALFNNGFDLGATNTTKWLSRADALGIAGNSDMTIMKWIKLQTAIVSGGYELFIHASNSGADRYQEVRYNYNSGTPQIQVDNSSTTYTYNITLSTSVFKLIAVTRNVAGNSSHLWIDGIDVANGALGSSGAGANYFDIGANNAGSFLNSAIIDDVSIFNRVLTGTEILNYFNGPSSNSAFLGFM